MWRFAFSPETASALGPRPEAAFLFAADGTALPSSITVEPGLLTADTAELNVAGLALVVTVDRPVADAARTPARSRLLLPTCLLPRRDQPFRLWLELARRRLMDCVSRLEAWGLFELPADAGPLQLLERAREAFTAALVTAGSTHSATPLASDRTAQQALALAVEAGDALASHQAMLELRGRLNGETYARALRQASRSPLVDAGTWESPAGRTHHESAPAVPVKTPDTTGVVLPSRPAIGCGIGTAEPSPQLHSLALDLADFIAVPMRWLDMEPSEGQYRFALTDRWIEWSVRQAKRPVVAGPVVDFSPASVPDWLFIWENDHETLRELVYEHVRQIVTRYRRTVSRWTITSGLHTCEGIALGLEQMLDLTRVGVMAVRKLHPAARVQVEITQPWGEYVATQRRGVPPWRYAEAMLAAGISVDAIALRIEMGTGRPGAATRDLLQLSTLLDRYAELDRPIVVSALSAPASPPRSDLADAGFWRQPWSESQQAQWLVHATTIALSKPFVHSVCWDVLVDPPNQACCGLVDPTGRRREAANRLAAIRRDLAAGAVVALDLADVPDPSEVSP